jgi:hypothetical protein
MKTAQPHPLGKSSLSFLLTPRNDLFGDISHRSARTAAFALDLQIRFLFTDAQLPLQNALGSLDQLSRLELLDEFLVLALQARHFDIRSD